MIHTHLQFHKLSHEREVSAEVNMSRGLEFKFSLPLFLTCIHNTTEQSARNSSANLLRCLSARRIHQQNCCSLELFSVAPFCVNSSDLCVKSTTMP